MSWRVVATVMIAIFALLMLMMTTAAPLYQATDMITDADDNAGEGGQFDTERFVNDGIRGYFNAILLLIFGLIGWGGWYLLKNELTETRL